MISNTCQRIISSDSVKVLAFDLGGSHVSSALVAGAVQTILSAPIGPDAACEDILAEFEDLGKRTLQMAGIDAHHLSAISIAAPNPFDYHAGISLLQHKHQSLYGISLRSEIARRFSIPEASVVFIHDAQAFLLGEMSIAGIQTADRVVGITLGTGIGAAFASQGRILTHGSGIPENGEIYNLPWTSNTVEDVLSTRSILEAYRTIGGYADNVASIASHAEQQEPKASAVMRSFGATLGIVLNEVLKDFAPQMIVIGGGIARSADLFITQTKANLKNFRPTILVSDSIDGAALAGAAKHWELQCSDSDC